MRSSPPYVRTQGNFTITTDPAWLDPTAIHAFLSEHSYWAQGIPVETVERALAGSLCFGLYHHREQVGLARVVTDGATVAYLCDVYILPYFRGQGLSKWLMRCILDHPDLQGLRRWLLATRDAHSLYAQVGFTPLSRPEVFMEISRPDLYLQNLS